MCRAFGVHFFWPTLYRPSTAVLCLNFDPVGYYEKSTVKFGTNALDPQDDWPLCEDTRSGIQREKKMPDEP